MNSVNPYLLFNGDAEEAFTFYKSIFGGELDITRYGDMGEGGDVPEEIRSKVANVALPLAGDSTGVSQVLMASDAPPGQMIEITKNARYMVNLSVDTAEEAERLFAALSEGGEVIESLEEKEWAQRFGMCADKYSVQWMINCYKDTA